MDRRCNLTFLLFFLLLCIIPLRAQQVQTDEGIAEKETNKLIETLGKKLKISGYIQGQYQYGQQDASLKVGSSNENPEESFSRIGIRRGRVKLTYTEGIVSGVFQLDITEKGVSFKDIYINVTDPWFKTNALRAGVFDRPFGYEISYSSSRRETPERSTVFQTLFPEERDMGAMLVLQPATTSPLHLLRLEAGWFAGNGIKEETDSKRDFIGHLSATKRIGKQVEIGGGASYYHGSVFQGTENIYTIKDHGYSLNNDAGNKGKFAKREYFGFDARIVISSILGKTHLRSEYLFGQQPGSISSSKSPNSSSRPTHDTYIRNFAGGYVLFVHDIGQSPFSAVLKYDRYDPNTKLSGDEIGLNNSTETDLYQNTWALGGLWRITKHLRLQACYEFNKNEETTQIADWNINRKNDVFTLRLQYSFP